MAWYVLILFSHVANDYGVVIIPSPSLQNTIFIPLLIYSLTHLSLTHSFRFGPWPKEGGEWLESWAMARAYYSMNRRPAHMSWQTRKQHTHTSISFHF